ncbi:unnamed protein product, partial [Choristocarpus tenellus]
QSTILHLGSNIYIHIYVHKPLITHLSSASCLLHVTGMSSLPTEPNPPFGVVVGAGVVGATAGQVVFKNPLISVGLGLGAMGLAATGEHSGGELARSSGRMALAAFERGNEVNQRYAFTDKIAQGLKTTLERAKHLDEEHHIVEKTRDRASHAFEQLKK